MFADELSSLLYVANMYAHTFKPNIASVCLPGEFFSVRN